ncbi:MAG: hypothetical protein Q9213_006842 [Squamulea squamosa]
MSESSRLSHPSRHETLRSIDSEKVLTGKSQKSGPKRSRKETPTRDGSAESNERGRFTSTDKGTVHHRQTPNRAQQETSRTKRRTPPGEESEPKRPGAHSTTPTQSSSRLDIRRHDEGSNPKQLSGTAKMVACDNYECKGFHSPDQCPLPIICRGCHSKDHTLSDCLKVCKRCGRPGHTTRYHDDVVPIVDESQVSGPLARQNSERQEDASQLALERLPRDDTRGQRTELAPPTSHDSQIAAFLLRQQRIEQEDCENMIQLAEMKFRIEENELKKAHLRDERRGYDILIGKRQESAHKCEQLNEQLEELRRQRDEDERQYEIQHLAMNERQERELTEFRQRQKKRPESAPR